jgi:hypothetical protein
MAVRCWTSGSGGFVVFKQLMKVARGFKLVHIGVTMVVAGLIGFIVSVFMFFFAGAAIAGGGGGGRGAAAGFAFLGIIILAIVFLCFLAGSIVHLIGMFFCLAVPEKAGNAKLFISISIALILAVMALGSLNFLGSFARFEFGLAVNGAIQMGWGLLEMAACVLFLLFTKAVARFVRRGDLAEKAMSVLWLYGIAIGLYFLGFIVWIIMAMAGVAGGLAGGGGVRAAAGGAMAGFCLGSIVIGAGLIFALIALIRFISLMKEMHEVVERYAWNNRRTKRSKRGSGQKRRKSEDEDEDEEEDEDDDDEDYLPPHRGRDRWGS